MQKGFFCKVKEYTLVISLFWVSVCTIHLTIILTRQKKRDIKLVVLLTKKLIKNLIFLIKKIHTVCDIGCAPGSWLQYAAARLQALKIPDAMLIWFDIQDMHISLPHVQTYKQDISDDVAVKKLLEKHNIQQFDLLISDMAPNTMGDKALDAIRLFNLLESTLWMYKNMLKKDGKFVTKLFMGPWFEEYIQSMKDIFGGKNIKILKTWCKRANSKETYVIKV